MKVLSLSLICLAMMGHSYAETITPSDRFYDNKTKKYLYVCETNGDELIAKESCGKFWDKFPRKREDLIKEVSTYKDLNKHDLVMITIKDHNGNPKTIIGKISWMYENGRIDVMEYYTQRFGYNPGTTHWSIDYRGVTKLNDKHPLAKHAELCAKEDTEITYNYNNKRKFSIKKGEKVALKGIFDNGTAAVSLYNIGDNFLGYGMDNKLPLSLDKLEVCESEKTGLAIDDSSRSQTKPEAAVQEASALDSYQQNMTR